MYIEPRNEVKIFKKWVLGMDFFTRPARPHGSNKANGKLIGVQGAVKKRIPKTHFLKIFTSFLGSIYIFIDFLS